MVMVRGVGAGHLIGRVCHLLRIGTTGIGMGSKDGIGGIECGFNLICTMVIESRSFI
jgi:hypothetical protein